MKPGEVVRYEGDAKVVGWKSIAKSAALSERTAQRYARRRLDPLPVYVYAGKVQAEPAALRAWMRRNTIPLASYVASGAKTP